MATRLLKVIGIVLILCMQPVLNKTAQQSLTALSLDETMNEEQRIAAFEAFAEEYFDIPDDFPLSDIFRYDDGSYTLQWTRPRSEYAIMGGIICATIAGNGDLAGYEAVNAERPKFDLPWNGFARIQDRATLEREAFAVIQALSPQSVAELSTTALPNTLDGYDYFDYETITFPRLWNGIPLENQGIGVRLDSQMQRAVLYSRRWMDVLPSQETDEGIISREQMLEILKDSVCLSYRTPFFLDMQPMLVYSSTLEDSAFMARNGLTFRQAFRQEQLSLSAEVQGSMPWASYGLIHHNTLSWFDGELPDTAPSVAQLEQSLRTMSEIDFPENAVLDTYTCHADTDQTIWQLNWRLPGDEAVVNAIFDAYSGQLLSYQYGFLPILHSGYQEDPQHLLQRELLAKAEMFAATFYAEEFTSCDRDAVIMQGDLQPPLQPEARRYAATFIWQRRIDGILCPDNGISVSVDSVTGKIAAFGITWWPENVFPKQTPVISLEEAKERFASDLSLTLVYRTYYDDRARLAYIITDLEHSWIKAVSGYWYGYRGDGSERRRIMPNEIPFDNLAGHPEEEEITLLARLGLIPIEERFFEPSRPILQKEYLLCLGALSNDYFLREPEPRVRDLVNRVFVKISEYKPDENINNAEALCYLLRLAGYDKAAELDSATQLPDLAGFSGLPDEFRGYVTIARSLGLIDDAWSWSKTMTYLDTALLFNKVITRA